MNYKIIIGALACLGLGIASGFSTVESINNWYQYLNKPSWNPPNWLFGPVWTVLYILMGIAFGLIWSSENAIKNKAMLIFGIQFILNLAWSFLFFNLHQLGWALVEIITMLIFILLTINYFYKIKPKAAYLLIPYLLWVSFATFLNYSIWSLN